MKFIVFKSEILLVMPFVDAIMYFNTVYTEPVTSLRSI